jgi:hypothetical protein
MSSRADLHDVLTTIVSNAYFQPPPSISMTYPCIVYQLDDIDTDFANNFPYSLKKGYKLTVIDPNPESTIPDQVAMLPKVSFDRFYTADNLNHYVFTIYF